MNAASYRLTAILFGIAVTLHNLEEGMFLVKWARAHVKLWFTPDPKIYWVMTSLVSVVIWIPIAGVSIAPKNAHFQYALAGFAITMAINAVLPHLVISIAMHSYSPGTGTGMLLNLPIGLLLIYQQLSAQAI